MMIAILLSAGTFLNAPDTARHPIDIKLERCLSHSNAIMPRAECYSTAYTAWEKDIDVSEKKLLAKAGEKEKVSLAASQIAWEKYRDARFQQIADRYNKMRGTGYIPVRVKVRMEILRERALQLEKELKTATVPASVP